MAVIANPERRRFDRSDEPAPLHRRQGQLVHTRLERRRSTYHAFDIAAALELHLDEYPTREAILVLLQTWFYQAELSGLGEHAEGYATALARAAEVMRAAPDAEIGIAMLRRAAN